MRTVPWVPNQLMWSRWGLIHGIGFTELGTPSYGIHALLKCYETTIRGTAFITSLRAPWVLLRVGGSGEHSRCNDHTEYKHRFHPMGSHQTLLGEAQPLVRIAPLDPRERMWTRWRLILGVRFAKAADPAHIF
jgi:hypothetical protein